MRLLVTVLSLGVALASQAADKIKVLIIDGQNNHKWESTTPVMKASLEASGVFAVDVSTSPPAAKKAKPEEVATLAERWKS